MTICDILYQRSIENADRLAFTFQDGAASPESAWTYGQLASSAAAIATQLRAAAARRRRPVICALPPGPAFVAAFFGCLWDGFIAVPCAPPRAGVGWTQVRELAERCGAELCLVEAAGEAAGCASGLRCVIIPSEPMLAPTAPPTAQLTDVAYLQYTSGSTGVPKGVVVRHGSLMANSAAIAEAFQHTCDSIGVIWLPPHHDMGLVGGVVQPIYAGFPVHLMPPSRFLRNPLSWLSEISRRRATTSGGPNFGYEHCLARIPISRAAEFDLSSWRVAFSGAEPVAAETIERFSAGFAAAGFRKEAFVPCYGLAEATLMVTSRRPTDRLAVFPAGATSPRAYVGCGSPVGCEVVLVDPKTRRRIISGTRGEIWVRGAGVASGYWRDPADTRRVFQARLRGEVETHLRTGDIGFWQDGELVVCGRLKGMAVIRGVNHSLEDIEHTAQSAHPLLVGSAASAFVVETTGSEALVILQEAPNEKGIGEEAATAVRAAVVARHGVAVSDVRIVKAFSLPRTRSGKVQREAARVGYLDSREASAARSAESV